MGSEQKNKMKEASVRTCLGKTHLLLTKWGKGLSEMSYIVQGCHIMLRSEVKSTLLPRNYIKY